MLYLFTRNESTPSLISTEKRKKSKAQDMPVFRVCLSSRNKKIFGEIS